MNNKKRNLNVAQTMLIAILCNTSEYGELEVWLSKHPVFAGIMYALFQIFGLPLTIAAGFKRPADDSLDAADIILTSAQKTNLAFRENMEES